MGGRVCLGREVSAPLIKGGQAYTFSTEKPQDTKLCARIPQIDAGILEDREWVLGAPRESVTGGPRD